MKKKTKRKKRDKKRHAGMPPGSQKLSLKSGRNVRTMRTVRSRVLGEGTYGKVHSKVDRNTGKKIAVKVMKSFDDEEGFSFSALRECDIYARFIHPFIPKVHKIEIKDHHIHLSLEHADCSVYKWLSSSPKIDFADRIRMGVQALWNCLQVLQYFHTYGVLHRDIKPENMLLFGRTVMLADMGSSRCVGGRGCPMTGGMGTEDYRAPEMYTSKYGKPSEVYSLGCSIVEILTGTIPHPADVCKSGFTTPAEWYALFSSVRRRIPTSLWSLVRSMIYAEPSNRITVKEALDHPLFDKCPYKRDPVPDSVRAPYPGDYIKGRSLPMTHADRKVIVEWMVDVGTGFRLSGTTIHDAVTLFDDYLLGIDKAMFRICDMHMYAMSALWICSKIHEQVTLPLRRLVHLCKRKYTEDDFLDQEEDILTVLNFQIIRRPMPKYLKTLKDAQSMKKVFASPQFLAGLAVAVRESTEFKRKCCITGGKGKE